MYIEERGIMTTLLFACMIAYLVGSIPTGKIIAHYKGVDIQSVGTGNIGASNTYLSLGKKLGFLVLIGDLGKAFLFVQVSMFYLTISEVFIASLFLLLGNIKSLFLKFTGGKGIATSLGIFLATEPIVAIVLVFVWGIGVVLQKYIFFISVSGIFIVPFTYYMTNHDRMALFCSFVICLMILIRHRSKFTVKEDVDGAQKI